MWLAAVYIFYLSTIKGLEVEIISLLPYGAPIVTSLIFTGAALDLAIEKGNARYAPHIKISSALLYSSKKDNCDIAAANTASMLSEYYYRQLKPGVCSSILFTGENLYNFRWQEQRFLVS